MVKRYQDVTNHFGPDAWTEMKESESGAWVDYVDYAALAERCKRMEDALRELADSADSAAHGYNTSLMDQAIDLARTLISGSSGGKDG
jgi:hypothetical protein